MNKQNAPLFILVAAETFHSQSQFLPQLEDLRKDPYDKHWRTVRTGQIYSGVWSFVIAVVVAKVTDSAIPYAIWLAGTALTCAISEYQMRESPEVGYGYG